MIAVDGGETVFGSGRLLDDLVQYVYSGEGCRLLLTGDDAQLPPVGELHSAALDVAYMEGYGLRVFTAELTEVVRQAEESGILWNATQLRRRVAADTLPDGVSAPSAVGKNVRADTAIFRLRTEGLHDVMQMPGNELIEALGDSYGREGMDEVLVITRSNRKAMRYNQGIRRTILDFEEELCRGDRIMICHNHYGTNAPPSTVADTTQEDFIANGDMAVVRRVRREREVYGFRFADVTFTLTDAPDEEREEVLLLDVLSEESPALSKADSRRLYEAAMENYAHLPRRADQWAALRKDPYCNALQAKYGYAVTAHKAQGGQWAHVYLDTGFVPPEQLTVEYLRWLYTAITRATKRLYLVNY
jgi:exodeoxyribonuclease-5